jgi:hypothetical protein
MPSGIVYPVVLPSVSANHAAFSTQMVRVPYQPLYLGTVGRFPRVMNAAPRLSGRFLHLEMGHPLWRHMLLRTFSAVFPTGTRRAGEDWPVLSEQSATATAVREGIPTGSAHHWHALAQSSQVLAEVWAPITGTKGGQRDL